MPISQTPPVKTLTINICAEEEPLVNLMSALFAILDNEEFEVLPDTSKLQCVEFVRDIALLRVRVA